ncbi:MAG: maleylpyruvate isomerase family mycothiol-dependent enzyme [Frankiaceae bacterium]|nr:maleylpyruvate isomerase family mycothiol-dependent enzyme [Frankiaceae bacterium]
MADDAKTWALIHAERRGLADTIEGLTEEQWRTPSLCAGWSCGNMAAHLLSSAEQSAGHFMGGMLKSGFSFNRAMQRDIDARADLTPQQIAQRLRQRTTTTNKPPAATVAMLGEVVVHGEDLRRPLGLSSPLDKDAANACLDMYTKASFPVGGKKRIGGLRLVSTDTGWTYGDGAEVTGSAMSLLLAMTGRPAGLAGLNGPGAPQLGERLTAGAAR